MDSLLDRLKRGESIDFGIACNICFRQIGRLDNPRDGECTCDTRFEFVEGITVDDIHTILVGEEDIQEFNELVKWSSRKPRVG